MTLDADAAVVAWPEFPTQWGSFQISQVSELDVVEVAADLLEYRQVLSARLWEPGDYETPETLITYQQAGDSETSTLTAQTLFFAVPSVLNSDNEALAASKGPVRHGLFSARYNW